MDDKIVLRGITWNHPRGYESIEAVSRAFSKKHTNVEIIWNTRSLKDFGDYPVTLLAEKYDFIMLDHPHIGSAEKAGALLPLDEWLSADFLEDQEKNSVGRSFESYRMDGHQWALAVDAAAQISAYRPDLMEKSGAEIPRTWAQVYDLAKGGREYGSVGFPLCQTDVYCSFLSIGANLKGDSFFDYETGPDHEASMRAVGLLRKISEVVHPESMEMNPIQMLERMAATDEILYVPMMFGYSNYARPSERDRKLIRFTNIPSVTGVPSGALLGGVGLAVSSRCKAKELAAEFAMFTAGGEIQKGIYYENAGQPGYLGAWTDKKVNESCHGFFEDTLDTLKNSYLRPRYEGYNEFQEKAGVVLNLGLKERKDPEVIVRRIEELFRSLKRGENGYGRHAASGHQGD